MLPDVFLVRQTFPRPRVVDLAASVRQACQQIRLKEKVQPGQSVAITAGSRGIANLALILGHVVAELKALGANPWVVPAMGSHGGATAEGQQALLAEYGVTAETCGCPIRSSMQTRVVGQAPEGFPIHLDALALGADHILVCNRIKPHTMFVGDIESGLMKMLLIGLGKHEGAKVYHRAIQNYSFGQIVRGVGRFVLQNTPILGGIALVENAYEETALVQGVLPNEFEVEEPKLLRMAKDWLPRLPVEQLDLLLVDEIGKEISGTGMDTNVIGRKFNDKEARPEEFPKIRRIAVRGLTEQTRGNACGLGIADVCHERVVQAFDAKKTATNCLTAGHLSAGALPLAFPSDRAMLEAVLDTIGLTPPEQARLVWIANTLRLTEVVCGAALWKELQGRPGLELPAEPAPLQFDTAGNLRSPFTTHGL